MKHPVSPPRSISRRDALKAAGAAALPLLAAPALSAAADAPKKASPIGIATLRFRNLTNAELAEELAGAGLKLIQLFLTQKDSNYWKYNNRSDVSDLTPDRCREIADAYRSKGITIHSIGVYTNLIHPDPEERNANLDHFEDMMKIGAAMDVRTFITEAGHYHPEPVPGEKSHRVAHHFQQTVWPQMVETGRELVKRAEAHDATVLVEPFFRGFFASAKRTRLFLEEIDSARLRALLDPANLLEVNDLEEMFDQLQPWIDCLHAKDRKLHVEDGVGAGQGDLDYPEFVSLAAARTPGVPLIMEYVGPEDYKQALAHLKNAMREAGLKT